MEVSRKQQYSAIFLAVLAMIIWSGNFIIARDVHREIPPVGLNFYRWALASLILLPIGFSRLRQEWGPVLRSWKYLTLVALTGVSMFNTFVYVGAHYTSAINLALIGTTSSPVFSVILARIFLKERIGVAKVGGLLLCIVGILYLLSRGSIENLLTLRFTAGDAWVLGGALTFAVYNTLVRKKPRSISSLSFLTASFIIGTLLLIPFVLWEAQQHSAVNWNMHIAGSILYLALGASVICFVLWNIVIGRLGTGRAALFGNLIPVFTSLAAVVLLDETFTWTHAISMILVFSGILIANLRPKT
ncbi:MAG TPA: DMT family transporter [Chitinophagaceae bacterium]|nr:DMT family transporter [Chitinophagaceae bacterium]